MSGSGSPCGACKFLRRKCVRGCVFAPYFCHEQGAAHFAAIHKVFGASNVSKLLAHLPVSDRCEAAVTISYEAQARLQDPIYGCVSHIFALQQQVVNLQAQLACLREQAAQSFLCASVTENPNHHKYCEKPNAFPQDLQCLFQTENSNMEPQFLPNLSNNSAPTSQCYGNNSGTVMDANPLGNYGNSATLEESICFSSFDETRNSMSMSYEADDLLSVAFGYSRSATSREISESESACMTKNWYQY
ncbi:hypothetical protein L6164_010004 [Bauhinia variegata]|uniref:Uncharacterized protein n=1 Tax=Bauhinia variegata TaxID=167791 RepID=A0ACB9PN09_BAUVA|nr:hypothetical protein L6164_010004 [Bauhinia variegata]